MFDLLPVMPDGQVTPVFDLREVRSGLVLVARQPGEDRAVILSGNRLGKLLWCGAKIIWT